MFCSYCVLLHLSQEKNWDGNMRFSSLTLSFFQRKCTGVSTLAQWNQCHFCSTRTQVQFLPQHSGLKDQVLYSLGHNCGPGTPYAAKMKKKKCTQKNCNLKLLLIRKYNKWTLLTDLVYFNLFCIFLLLIYTFIFYIWYVF